MRPAAEETDVLLVQPDFPVATSYRLVEREIPLNLCYLASYTDRRGIRSRILDLFLSEDPAESLKRTLDAFRPSVLGLTAFTANFASGARIARLARDLGFKGHTVVGGAHASALPEETLAAYPCFDFVVCGEGEEPLTRLASALREGRSVEGITGLVHRKEGHATTIGPSTPVDDLDSLPFPDRDKVPLASYRPNPANYLRMPNTGLLFSRGCPFRCTFCSNSVWRSRVRYRSAGNVLEEIDLCMRKYGIRDYRFFDEGITANRRAVTALCEGILDRGWKLSWNCFSRVDRVDPELLRLMRRSGCYHIKYGVEAGTDRVLGLLNKRITLEDTRRAVRDTKRAGIECQANVLFAVPGETLDEMHQTIRFVRDLSPDLVTFHVFRPLPGSELYEQLRREGRLLEADWDAYILRNCAPLIKNHFSEEVLAGILRKANLTFHFRVEYVLQRLKRILRHPRREIHVLAVGLRLLLPELLASLAGRRGRTKPRRLHDPYHPAT